MPASKGIALAGLGTGVLFVISGVHGWRVSGTIQDLLTGKNPSTNLKNTEPIVDPSNWESEGPFTTSAGGNVLGSDGTLASPSALATDAQQYAGHPYYYGGYYDNPKGWDCSSFINYVLGNDFGLTLPGGVKNYTGSSHGPVVGQYQLWTGAHSVSKNAVQPGDLILYSAKHMGMAVSGTDFISAETPASGTGIAPISSGPGPWRAVRLNTGNLGPSPKQSLPGGTPGGTGA